MKPHLFVRTELTIPGVGVTTHIAELLDEGDHCTVLRIVELMPNDTIGAAATQHRAFGMPELPSPTVPHPDTYDAYPGLTAERISPQDFKALWQAAQVKFPDLSTVS